MNTTEVLSSPELTLPAIGDLMASAPAVQSAVEIRTYSRIEDVECTWAKLRADTVESPGQSYVFVKLWIEALGIPNKDQLFVAASLDGEPLVLLPLWRQRVHGIRQLSFFPGSHVGCNAPLIDHARLAALNPEDRSRVWQKLAAQRLDADMMALCYVPQALVGDADLFAELGTSLAADTLYRGAFTSWDNADKTQRNKSRRKHDRQQGDRLDALGAVDFEEVRPGPEAAAILDIMFRQRAARFHDMGVADPFRAPEIQRFYYSTVKSNSPVDVRLHVLRLNGEVVAVRYNIAEGDRLFCLISSMSDDPAVQGGSPGKQCLLRVMQTVFETGFRIFDMGAGFTDEKRHWCNVQIPVRHHYLPLTRRGRAYAALHQRWQSLRHGIKSDPRLLDLAKRVRGFVHRARAPVVAAPEPTAD